MSGVDDLFSAEAPAPVVDRLGRAAVLLGVATPLTMLGPTCFTGVPGAVLALIAWQTADEEVVRVERGALPADRLVRARRLRSLSFALLLFSVLSFVLQIALFAFGFYDLLLGSVAALVTGGEAP